MKFSLEGTPVRDVMPGFRGQFIHSDNMTFAYWKVAANALLPEHSHPHEQVVNMLEGELEMTVEGVTHVLRTGDVLAIPGNAVHSGRALSECRALDVFCPVREDYR